MGTRTTAPELEAPEARTGVFATRLRPGRVARAFCCVAGSVVLAHVAVQAVRFLSGKDRLFGLVALFSMGSERSVATFYSVLAIVCAAGLFAYIGLRERGPLRRRAPWLGLGAIFVFLAFDEMASLHEVTIEPLRNALGTTGVLYYAWVIPYGFATLLLAVAYVPFLRRLPRRTAALLIGAGALFVAGAIGLEMVSGWYLDSLHGANSHPMYVLFQTLEETFEIAGIILCIYALFDYIDRHVAGFGVTTGFDGKGSGPHAGSGRLEAP